MLVSLWLTQTLGDDCRLRDEGIPQKELLGILPALYTWADAVQPGMIFLITQRKQGRTEAWPPEP